MILLPAPAPGPAASLPACIPLWLCTPVWELATCALCTLQSTICSLQWLVCSLWCTVCSLQCIGCSLKSIVCSLQFKVCSLQSAVFMLKYAVCTCSVQSAVYCAVCSFQLFCQPSSPSCSSKEAQLEVVKRQGEEEEY